MGRLDELDRLLGERTRTAVARVPGAATASRVAAAALAPAAESLVASLLMRPEERRVGGEALIGAASASALARIARDRIARPRPGERDEGGWPSRHAAAATAIARAVTRRNRRLAPWCIAGAALGLAARVASGDHEPGDIVAGAALGWGTDWIVEHLLGGAA